MKLVATFCAILALGTAQQQYRPLPSKANYQPGYEKSARILQQSYDLNPDGSYIFGFNTENGITAQEQGTPNVPGPEGNAIGVQGFFKHNTPEGVPVSIQYTADADGYHPVGDILPTPPPTPPAILRALAYIAANYRGEDHQYNKPQRYN